MQYIYETRNTPEDKIVHPEDDSEESIGDDTLNAAIEVKSNEMGDHLEKTLDVQRWDDT